MSVESVITFTYDKIVYWGTIEGVARGLPTEVYENPKLPSVNLGPTGWGFKINETKTEVRAAHCPLQFYSTRFSFLVIQLFNAFVYPQVRTVSAVLEPGTSINVTLHGDYTKMEGPYKAKLKSYYADTTETKTRDIEGIVSGFQFFISHFSVSRLDIRLANRPALFIIWHLLVYVYTKIQFLCTNLRAMHTAGHIK